MLKEKININGMEYVLVGDYYVPNIPLTDDEIGIGFYGRKHLSFMREYNREKYEELLHTNTLHDYLKDFEQMVLNRKQKLLSQCFREVGLSNDQPQNPSIEWMRKVHLIYTEVDVILRAEYVYK